MYVSRPIASPSATSWYGDLGALQRRLPAARQVLGALAADAIEQHGRSLPAEQVLREALSNESATAVTVSSTAELTQREVEVAGLIERGLTNGDIATRLILSERTAHAHVRNILSKPRLASPTQVALWVGEQFGGAPSRDAPSGSAEDPIRHSK
jgi:DNA-binding CsgD family transcriptional regulator